MLTSDVNKTFLSRPRL